MTENDKTIKEMRRLLMLRDHEVKQYLSHAKFSMIWAALVYAIYWWTDGALIDPLGDTYQSGVIMAIMIVFITCMFQALMCYFAANLLENTANRLESE